MSDWKRRCLEAHAKLEALVNVRPRDRTRELLAMTHGWVLYSADFALKADQRSDRGSVRMRRTLTEVMRWQKLSALQQSRCPVYVTGWGETIEEATANALMAAMAAPTVPDPDPPEDKEAKNG